ncbi:hypothetical protein D3C85_554260 [compost metagenome]
MNLPAFRRISFLYDVFNLTNQVSGCASVPAFISHIIEVLTVEILHEQVLETLIELSNDVALQSTHRVSGCRVPLGKLNLSAFIDSFHERDICCLSDDVVVVPIRDKPRRPRCDDVSDMGIHGSFALPNIKLHLFAGHNLM